jgi:hypothetical protein
MSSRPGTTGVEAANAAAKAAQDAAYQSKRAEALTIAAGALVIADTVAQGLRPGAVATDGPGNRIEAAFNIAEAFIAEAERRLGGKIPF